MLGGGVGGGGAAGNSLASGVGVPVVTPEVSGQGQGHHRFGCCSGASSICTHPAGGCGAARAVSVGEIVRAAVGSRCACCSWEETEATGLCGVLLLPLLPLPLLLLLPLPRTHDELFAVLPPWLPATGELGSTGHGEGTPPSTAIGCEGGGEAGGVVRSALLGGGGGGGERSSTCDARGMAGLVARGAGSTHTRAPCTRAEHATSTPDDMVGARRN